MEILKIVLIFVCLFVFQFDNCLASIHVVHFNKSTYLGDNIGGDDDNSCKEWRLSAKQIEKIFSLSGRYKDNSVTMGYYWYWFPCEISGEIMENSKVWHFVINAAATATWSDGKKTIYWGCSKEECDRFFIMPYQGRGEPVL